MGTLLKIALALAGTGMLGTVGYFGNQYLHCRQLEDRYLNSISDMKSSILTGSLVSDKSLRKQLEELKAMRLEETRGIILELHEQCGGTAADTAVRKGSEMLVG